MKPKEYYDKLMSGKLVYDIPFPIIESSATYFDSIIELIDSVYPFVRSVNIIGKRGIGKSTFARYWSFKKNINYLDSINLKDATLETNPFPDSVLKLVEENHSDEPLIIDDATFLTKHQCLTVQSRIRNTFLFVTQNPEEFGYPTELIILFSKFESDSYYDFWRKYPKYRQVPVIVVNPDYYSTDTKLVWIGQIEKPEDSNWNWVFD